MSRGNTIVCRLVHLHEVRSLAQARRLGTILDGLRRRWYSDGRRCPSVAARKTIPLSAHIGGAESEGVEWVGRGREC